MVHFIVHGKDDSVGVMTVDVKSGDTLSGWNMETDATLTLQAAGDILLGHKIALTEIPSGTAVIKYNYPIGNASENIKTGQHVHTHNLKTARW